MFLSILRIFIYEGREIKGVRLVFDVFMWMCNNVWDDVVWQKVNRLR
jgi:hypothetical protein